MSTVITVFAIIVVAVATFATLFFSISAIAEEAESIAVAIWASLGAVVLTGLSICAVIWHWWLFAPIVILVAGVWQRLSYSHASWLLLIGLLMVAWFASALDSQALGDIVNLILGRFVYPLVAALIYASLSLKSLEEDSLEEKIEEIVDEKIGR